MSDRSQRAGRNKAVAEEAPSSAAESDPTTSPAPAREQEAVTDQEAVASDDEPRRCCDENETVLVTDGIATEPIAYCAKHLPSNLR